MPRLSLTYLIPVLLFVSTIALFVHGWTRSAPEPAAPAATAATGGGASAVPAPGSAESPAPAAAPAQSDQGG